MRWLHFIWSGIQAYQEFWYRTHYKLSIQPPCPSNLVIPKHDYKLGTNIISISERKYSFNIRAFSFPIHRLYN